MLLKENISLNFSKKPRSLRDIRFLIIHYTGMQSKRASIERLLSKKYNVSCHFLIDRKGEIFEMVETFKVAWHAGKSKWGSYVNLNQHSIGIELENKGHKHGYQSYSKAQISKLIKLCKILKKKFKIIFKDHHPTDMRITQSNMTKSKKLLKYNPKISLKEGISRYINWHLKY